MSTPTPYQGMTPAQARAAQALEASIARLEAHLESAGPTARLSSLVHQFGDQICPARYFLEGASPLLEALRANPAPGHIGALNRVAELLASLRALPADDLTAAAFAYDSPYRTTARGLAPDLPLPQVDAGLYRDFAEKMGAFYSD